MKIWAFSDTHNKHALLDIPADIDMAICAGDIGTVRNAYENQVGVRSFLEWYNSLSHIKHKILIAGNHDTCIQAGLIQRSDMPESITYLEHETKQVAGLKVFGSPYTPSFGEGWAFNVSRNRLDNYYNAIENDTDIIITHGPPLGILDHTECGASGDRSVISCGCKALLNHVKRVNPKLHIFGHIHPEERCPNAAIMKIQDNRTKFVNAAVVDLDYRIHNSGHIIEI